ncbi:hypothetical protein [Bifidobacterium sp. UTBIF-78]|uniref:hypothetical protein n=1 Tax=Bifidobacterium sp. UTBIF-78 TaxID=1465263 RepID=UPI00112E81BE|nr:hypothetical protein [Bifidobacterium sp. UTBIF-78]
MRTGGRAVIVVERTGPKPFSESRVYLRMEEGRPMKSRFMGIGKDRQVRTYFAQTRIGKKWQTAANRNKSGMAKNGKHRLRRIL